MPRDLLEQPALFGRPTDVTWIEPTTPAEYATMRATELQHHCVVELTARLEQAERPKSWLEEQSGIAPGRLSKLLRGYAQLTLRDVAALEGVLGIALTSPDLPRHAISDPELRARFVHRR